MEDYILIRKQLSLLKNKNFVFKIPILINPMFTELIIEINNVKFDREILIELRLKNSDNSRNNVKIPVVLHSESKTVSLKEMDSFENANYLLLSCISNINIDAELSVKNI